MFSVYCFFFLPSSGCYRTWKLFEMAELVVQESEQEESRDRVLVNISMPGHHLALHINPLNSVFYNVLRVCKTSLPLTSPRVLTASGGEKGVVVIDGNIPGLWANTPREHVK